MATQGKAVHSRVAGRARWAKRIAQWAGSGQTQKAYCAKRGWALSTFQWWRARAKHAAAETAPMSFLCQGDPKFPQLWELKIPHPVHDSVSSVRTRPALSFSFSRYELPRMLRVTA